MKNSNLHNEKGGYSIIAAVLMVGFLLILTTSTLNLVLQEMQDGKGRQDYMKAYAGAEGALELGLMKIKQKGYGYDDDSFQDSEILGTGNKTPKLSYEFESRVYSYTGSIQPYQSDIIPLFSIDSNGNKTFMSHIDFSGNTDVVWNIVTQSGGISGKGNFTEATTVGEKTYNELTQSLEYSSSQSIGSILMGENYLILYNSNPGEVSYSLTSSDGFTLPRATISSSSQIGKYTQNLETLIDNTKFLGILKYSIYGGN